MEKVMVSFLILGTVLVGSSDSVHAVRSKNLPRALAELERISEEEAADQVQFVFAAIAAELQAGRAVTVPRFGRFYVKALAARKGRNPRTGAPIRIPARKYPRFRSSRVLKRLINEKNMPQSGS